MSKNNSEKSRSRIEKQAIEKIDEGADVIELITELDLSPYRSHGDTYDDWHASYSFEAMVRALYLKDLMGYNDTDLHQRLSDNPEEAEALGFDKLPDRTTFGRTWNDRLSQGFRNRVQHTTHRILEYSKDQGNPIGLRSLETEEKSDVSTRTENRVIREKSLEVAEDLRDLLYGAVDLQRPDTGTQYSRAEFLGLESYLCSDCVAAETGSDTYGDRAPKGVDVPDGDTLLHYIKQLDIDDIHKVIQQGINVQLKTSRRHLEFSRPVEVAIDMTYIPYYGERDRSLALGDNNNQVTVVGAPPSKDYDWCLKFATVSIVGDNVRFMLAVRPHIKGQQIGEIARELYWDAAEHVNIKRVYADSEFYTTETVKSLNEAGTDFVISVPRNQRVKRQIERADQDVWVRKNLGIRGSTSGGPTNSRAEVNHVGIPSNSDPEKTVVFATNEGLDDEIGLDRRETKHRINRYRRRWGQETNYRALGGFLPETTSKDFSVRLFHFGFAILVFNMWRLVDFLVQLTLDTELRSKPRITASRFQRLVEPVLDMYG
jgi:hypothetical protein